MSAAVGAERLARTWRIVTCLAIVVGLLSAAIELGYISAIRPANDAVRSHAAPRRAPSLDPRLRPIFGIDVPGSRAHSQLGPPPLQVPGPSWRSRP